MTPPIKMFACFCGAQTEGVEEAPDCWLCGAKMHFWKERMPFGKEDGEKRV